MKDNKYNEAIKKIEPDESFVSDTLKMLENKPKKLNALRFAVPAAAALAVIAMAIFAIPNIFGSDKTDGTNSSAVIEYESAGNLTSDVNEITAASATPLPLATLIPNPEPAPQIDGQNAIVPRRDKAGAAEYEEYELSDGVEILSFASESAFNEWNTEEYSAISESGFRNALVSPFSTFAADVDTAGYTTIRRRILSGSLPDADSIRTEELINYFHYEGLSPKDNSPAAISAYLGACPWNEDAALMFVGVGAKRIETDDLPRSNLVFLIDTSGSMAGKDRLDLIKRAFYLLSETLSEGDIVSIVTYSGSFSVPLEGADASERGKILGAVDSLYAYGSTNGGDGIKTAYKIAEKYFIEGGNNRVIMMTDGDLNVGITSESELVKLIEEKKQSGVFLSVLGFGVGNYKDNKLEALADHGNGVYSYIDGINEARRVLVTEMGANFYTVAKDVKLQVEFNPKYVSEYRLIGYENRLMSAEDFADDSKDGGEMGSGHTAVALYEIIPAEGVEIAGIKGKQSANALSTRYQSTELTEIDELAQISLRYKEPDGDTSRVIVKTVKPSDVAEGAQKDNLALASAISEFGMLLRDSEYKGASSYDRALELIKNMSRIGDDETELMYLITLAKQLEE